MPRKGFIRKLVVANGSCGFHVPERKGRPVHLINVWALQCEGRPTRYLRTRSQAQDALRLFKAECLDFEGEALNAPATP